MISSIITAAAALVLTARTNYVLGLVILLPVVFSVAILAAGHKFFVLNKKRDESKKLTIAACLTISAVLISLWLSSMLITFIPRMYVLETTCSLLVVIFGLIAGSLTLVRKSYRIAMISSIITAAAALVLTARTGYVFGVIIFLPAVFSMGILATEHKFFVSNKKHDKTKKLRRAPKQFLRH
jgi:uncharacterized membrane protein